VIFKPRAVSWPHTGDLAPEAPRSPVPCGWPWLSRCASSARVRGGGAWTV